MSDYKRLTEKENYDGYVEENCGNCHYYDKNKCSNKDCYEVIKRRLCELEDKIENGTLVELPCKVGDTFFRVEKDCSKCPFYKEDSWEYTCWCTFDNEDTKNMFDVDGDKDCVYIIEEHKFLPILKLSENEFLTKAEAEKRLKELQNENNCKI